MYANPTPAPARRLLAPATVLLIVAALTPAALSSDAPPRVDNPADPPGGRVELELRELWRRGGEDDDLFFGLIVQALVGPGGDLYLLDTQLNEVIVLSSDGEWLRTIGREGEGPGEFRRAGDLLLTGDGHLGVVQRFPGTIVLLTPDGLPAGTVLPGDPTTGGRDMLSGARSVPGGLLLSGAHMTRTDRGRSRRSFISLYGADGVERLEYLGLDDEIDFADSTFREIDQFFPGGSRWSADAEGRVYIAGTRDAYEITVHAPGGAPLQVIGRPYDPWPRTREILDRLETRWKSGRRYQRFGVEQEFAPNEPDILRLEVRGDELWVLPSRGVHDQPEGILQTWDVFDLDGRYDRRTALRGPGDGERDRVILLADDRALVVRGFQDARDALDGTGGEADDAELDDATPMEIIAYAIR